MREATTVFTGIVEEIGEIVEVTDLSTHAHVADASSPASGSPSSDTPGPDPLARSARLRIRGPMVVSDASPGDSIAVNGVCLTVVDPDAESFAVDVIGETLSRSSLADATVGARVNLERALAAGARLGGHIMQGHVDGTAVVEVLDAGEHWTTVRFGVAPRDGTNPTRYIADKGSIAVDGVSLTVVAVDDAGFSVGLIPTTLRETTLGDLEVGGTVNLEVDVVAKYVERLTVGHRAVAS